MTFLHTNYGVIAAILVCSIVKLLFSYSSKKKIIIECHKMLLLLTSLALFGHWICPLCCMIAFISLMRLYIDAIYYNFLTAVKMTISRKRQYSDEKLLYFLVFAHNRDCDMKPPSSLRSF